MTATRPVCLGIRALRAPAVQPAPQTMAASSPEILPHRTAPAGSHRAPAIITNPCAAPAAPVWPAAAAPSHLLGRKRGSPPCLVPCPVKAGEPVFANTSSSYFLDSSDQLKRRRWEHTLTDMLFTCSLCLLNTKG